MTIDKSRLSPNLWVRIMWVPRGQVGPDDAPIVMVTDRQRLWLSAIPMVLSVVIGIIAGLVLNWSAAGFILVLGLLFTSYYARGGKTGYYEVRQDGTLGDFLGKRVPAVLRYMERVKPEPLNSAP